MKGLWWIQTSPLGNSVQSPELFIARQETGSIKVAVFFFTGTCTTSSLQAAASGKGVGGGGGDTGETNGSWFVIIYA